IDDFLEGDALEFLVFIQQPGNQSIHRGRGRGLRERTNRLNRQRCNREQGDSGNHQFTATASFSKGSSDAKDFSSRAWMKNNGSFFATSSPIFLMPEKPT